MRPWIFAVYLFIGTGLHAQSGIKKTVAPNPDFREKYFSINPFSPAEPIFAIGPAFGLRTTLRSEYFTELAYISKSPFYDYDNLISLKGARLLLQYRYHFLQRWKPILNYGSWQQQLAGKVNFFGGLEFRYKPFNFSSRRTYINETTHDTLHNYVFNAKAVSIGVGIVFGGTINISRNNKWKLEFTCGIGAKQKLIRFINIPEGYTYEIPIAKDGHLIPRLEEEAGTAFIPSAIRLRYVIN